MRSFDPKGERYDLLLFLQPELSARHTVAHLTDTGYVLTNVGDYTAEELLFERSEFALLGHINLRTGKLSENVDSILPILRKSWANYQQIEKALRSSGINLEELKSYLPNCNVWRAWDLRDILVLRREA